VLAQRRRRRLSCSAAGKRVKVRAVTRTAVRRACQAAAADAFLRPLAARARACRPSRRPLRLDALPPPPSIPLPLLSPLSTHQPHLASQTFHLPTLLQNAQPSRIPARRSACRRESSRGPSGSPARRHALLTSRFRPRFRHLRRHLLSFSLDCSRLEEREFEQALTASKSQAPCHQQPGFLPPPSSSSMRTSQPSTAPSAANVPPTPEIAYSPSLVGPTFSSPSSAAFQQQQQQYGLSKSMTRPTPATDLASEPPAIRSPGASSTPGGGGGPGWDSTGSTVRRELEQGLDRWDGPQGEYRMPYQPTAVPAAAGRTMIGSSLRFQQSSGGPAEPDALVGLTGLGPSRPAQNGAVPYGCIPAMQTALWLTRPPTPLVSSRILSRRQRRQRRGRPLNLNHQVLLAHPPRLCHRHCHCRRRRSRPTRCRPDEHNGHLVRHDAVVRPSGVRAGRGRRCPWRRRPAGAARWELVDSHGIVFGRKDRPPRACTESAPSELHTQERLHLFIGPGLSSAGRNVGRGPHRHFGRPAPARSLCTCAASGPVRAGDRKSRLGSRRAAARRTEHEYESDRRRRRTGASKEGPAKAEAAAQRRFDVVGRGRASSGRAGAVCRVRAAAAADGRCRWSVSSRCGRLGRVVDVGRPCSG